MLSAIVLVSQTESLRVDRSDSKVLSISETFISLNAASRIIDADVLLYW